MIPATLLQSIDELSVNDKLALIEAITQMLQHDLVVNGIATQQNGATPEKPAVTPIAQQDMKALIAELLSRPNPTPEQMLPRGLFKGMLSLDEEDFRAAEWHPSEEELAGG